MANRFLKPAPRNLPELIKTSGINSTPRMDKAENGNVLIVQLKPMEMSEETQLYYWRLINGLLEPRVSGDDYVYIFILQRLKIFGPKPFVGGNNIAVMDLIGCIKAIQSFIVEGQHRHVYNVISNSGNQAGKMLRALNNSGQQVLWGAETFKVDNTVYSKYENQKWVPTMSGVWILTTTVLILSYYSKNTFLVQSTQPHLIWRNIMNTNNQVVYNQFINMTCIMRNMFFLNPLGHNSSNKAVQRRKEHLNQLQLSILKNIGTLKTPDTKKKWMGFFA